MFPWLLLVFLLVPLVEIYVLIQVGGVIGALPTVLLVVLTAVIGAALMRAQGFSTLARVQTSLDRGELPATALLEGVLILFAGALLLTPGFVTDAVGFVLLVPPWRATLATWFLRRGVTRLHVRFRGGHGPDTRGGARAGPRGQDTGEGSTRGRGPRGETRHRPGPRPGRVIEGEYERDDRKAE